jgi:hypothetical protein
MKCAYCGSSIQSPFTGKHKDGSNICFCDILCGRLYDVNVTSIEPLMKEYNRAYTANKLSSIARVSFERFNEYSLFKMIPVCTVKDTPEATKRYYIRLFGI